MGRRYHSPSVAALKRPQIPVSALGMGCPFVFQDTHRNLLTVKGPCLDHFIHRASKRLLWLFGSVSFLFEQFMHAVFYSFMVCGLLHVQYMFVTKGGNPVGLSPVFMRTGR